MTSASSVSPSNDTLPDDERSGMNEITLQLDSGPATFSIAPLTANVGKGQTPTAVISVTTSGAIRFASSSNYNNISKEDIAYISCDSDNSNTSGYIDPNTIVSAIELIFPKAVILYSAHSQNCNLNWTNPMGFNAFFTMTNVEDSTTLFEVLRRSPQLSSMAAIGTNSSTAGQGSSATSSNPGGPAPTTAVAMSILYSITGIITLLFLIIIATGAIRAHRHPERYGPRTGQTGRPRQSRAKGLARAMLETLPIVKFGDPEPVKPGSADVELESGDNLTRTSPETTEARTTTSRDLRATPKPGAAESGMGPDMQATSIKSGEEPAGKAGELGCSICTEDFTTGEDVRVLPCKHKYHPACIDPWLLNVSGTCPLCRHDLRPEASADATPSAEGDELPPPLSANDGHEAATGNDDSSDAPQRRRVSRFLDLNRLRTAPPDERIAALRRLREQSRREGEATEDVEERSRRARLTGRLRDTFRIRTRRQQPQQTDEPQS